MRQYIDLVQHVLQTGTRKENRTGIDTISAFSYHYKHDLRGGFPMLTTKSISWKNIVVENLWFLSGQTDISILKRHGCKFWDPWADESGKVPSAYGNFWRQFPVHSGGTVSEPSTISAVAVGPGATAVASGGGREFNDQIRWVLDEMRRNPMSRRMVVSAWAPGNAQTSKLPPCHCLYIFNVQNETKHYNQLSPEERPQELKTTNDLFVEKKRLCLHLTQRSCDVALGVPYNLAGYSFLLHLFAHMSGLEPGIFSHTLVDAHIYTSKPDGSMAEYDHAPRLREQILREPRQLPTLKIDPEIKDLKDIEALMDPSVSTEELMSHFVLEGYNPHPAISFKVAV